MKTREQMAAWCEKEARLCEAQSLGYSKRIERGDKSVSLQDIDNACDKAAMFERCAELMRQSYALDWTSPSAVEALPGTRVVCLISNDAYNTPKEYSSMAATYTGGNRWEGDDGVLREGGSSAGQVVLYAPLP